MRTTLITIFLFFLTKTLLAQAPYFQQTANYNIKVALNDTLHTLSGITNIEYINNSPNTLTEIYIHLWANAHQNRESTALAKQMLEKGSRKLLFADDKDLGGYTNIDFLIENEPLKWSYDKNNPDIASIQLKNPLKTGEAITIAVPFTLKIPASISRLGHIGQSYQATQWFPKVAVYDKNGWNAMPYLNQGEFYSDFGSYDVEITLPDNYIVAATGALQNNSEKKFLYNQFEATNEWIKNGMKTKKTLPPSSKNLKTLHYTAEKVHDFAWFADKQFYVQRSTITQKEDKIPEKKIETWAFFTDTDSKLWVNATNYINLSLLFYSTKVGEYPYPHCTAVQSALSAGAGMEYPMITVIGEARNAQELDIVITHEVGHNWFYGILATNERKHPWMDEGINSYYEAQYVRQFYKTDDASHFIPKFLAKPIKGKSISQLLYLTQARRHADQPIETPSEALTTLNYGLSAYQKPALILRYLENYVGTEKFDAIMRSFFQKWQFKHPQPDDFQAHWEAAMGKKMDWWFEDLLKTTKTLDYKIVSVRENEVTVSNLSNILAPIEISAFKQGTLIKKQWIEGFSGTQKITINAPDADKYMIDADNVSPDLYRSNNTWSKNGNLHFPKLDWLGTWGNDERATIGLLPALGWNAYDKAQLGIYFQSPLLPGNRFDYALAPMYAFGSKMLTGVGDLMYHIYPKQGIFEKIDLSVAGRKFSYNFDENYKFIDNYTKIAPKINFVFKKNIPTSLINNELSIRYVNITQQYGEGKNAANQLFETKNRNYNITEIAYTHTEKHALAPWNAQTKLQYGEGFMRLTGIFNGYFPIENHKKGIDFRAFAGVLPVNIATKAPINFNLSGTSSNNIFQQDYMLDEIIFGRNNLSGIWGQQIFNKDAGFKTLSNIAASNNWMVGANFKARISKNNAFFIQPYLDVAAYPMSGKTQLTYSAGIAAVAVPNVLEVYFPVIESKNIQESVTYQTRTNYFQRVTFLLNLQSIAPHKLLMQWMP
jgi:Peptidase family M1 domain